MTFGPRILKEIIVSMVQFMQLSRVIGLAHFDISNTTRPNLGRIKTGHKALGEKAKKVDA